MHLLGRHECESRLVLPRKSRLIPRFPVVPARRMILPWNPLPGLPGQILSVRASLHGVVVPEQAPLAQNRQQKLNDILKRPRENGIRQVEPVHVGLGHPPLHLVGHLVGGAHDGGSEPAYLDVVCDGVLGPFGHFWRRLGPRVDGRANGIRLDVPQLLVVAVLGEVDARPAAKERQRAVLGAVAQVLAVLGFGFLLRLSEHRAEQRQELDGAGVAVELRLCLLSNVGNALGDCGRAVAGNKDGFGILGRKGLAGTRRACL